MKLFFRVISFFSIFSILISTDFYGQIGAQNLGGRSVGEKLNTITTSVPFLMITPDSRSGAMGDVGVAISPDANAMHWNPAKLVFIDELHNMGFSISYAPWLKNLVPDINLAYLSGYKRIDRLSTVGASLRYFSLGKITFTDAVGTEVMDFNPNEFAFDIAYSRKLSDNFSGGVSAKYIYSNLTGGFGGNGGTVKNFASSVATDLSLYYITNPFEISDRNTTLAFGANISNIGAPMSYIDSIDSDDFLPTNLRLGSSLNVDLDEYNKFSLSFDVNKLLVPTQPIYLMDSAGRPVSNGNNSYEIVSGRDPNVSVASGIFGSFTDAPGVPLYDNNNEFIGVKKNSILKEELREINLSVGAEFLYNNLFAFRMGYFHEHWSKGARQFATFGFGVKYQVINIDVSYILVVNNKNTITGQNPLGNTIRFSVNFNLGDVKDTEK